MQALWQAGTAATSNSAAAVTAGTTSATTASEATSADSATTAASTTAAATATTWHRDAHYDLAAEPVSTAFCTELMRTLHSLLDDSQENWDAHGVVLAVITVAARTLELSHSAAAGHCAVQVLLRCRSIAYDCWAPSIEAVLSTAALAGGISAEVQQLRLKLVDVAAYAALTFGAGVGAHRAAPLFSDMHGASSSAGVSTSDNAAATTSGTAATAASAATDDAAAAATAAAAVVWLRSAARVHDNWLLSMQASATGTTATAISSTATSLFRAALLRRVTVLTADTPHFSAVLHSAAAASAGAPVLTAFVQQHWTAAREALGYDVTAVGLMWRRCDSPASDWYQAECTGTGTGIAADGATSSQRTVLQVRCC
jgi:hypothetical protein